VFIRAFHWSLSWASSIQTLPPDPISLRYNSILSAHLRLGLLSGLFPYGFPTNNLYVFVFTPFCSTCLTHLILLVLVILIILGEHYSLRSPLWSIYSLQHPVLKLLQSVFFP
jgi:hypothetical protein